MSYQQFKSVNGTEIKAWVHGVEFDPKAQEQVYNIASMPFITPHVAIMPDVHWGMGATIGSVIPTIGAIIPAAVGVDIGCGMIATKTSLTASDLPDNLFLLRSEIERRVPHGRTNNGKVGDRGAWHNVPDGIQFDTMGLKKIVDKHPSLSQASERAAYHMGTLGTGNHFIEICLDENQAVWIMLHSGSRGIGNRIGTYFIELAKKDMEVGTNLPDIDLAYLREGTHHFDDYVEAVSWAQEFARTNRMTMLNSVIQALKVILPLAFHTEERAVNCHHNYVQKEMHFGQEVWLTRKGAVYAGKDVLGIIPGSMGARSYIVKGKGNAHSFSSCSHGAGRILSRNQAKKKISLDDHIKATEGIECRKDSDVIDESPAAYKSIDAVMEAQSDLVEIVHTLKQVLCVKVN